MSRLSLLCVLGTCTASLALWAALPPTPAAGETPRAAGTYPPELFPLQAVFRQRFAGQPDAPDGAAAAFAGLTLEDLSVEPDGSLLVADLSRVVRLDPRGRIATVAGTGTDRPEPAAPTQALRSPLSPSAIAALPSGGFLVGTFGDIRRVDASGHVTVVAGQGELGDSGDGGPALAAKLDHATSLLPLPDGGFLFSDRLQGHVRRVDPGGTITRFAGPGGNDPFAGDGGPAVLAPLNRPDGLTRLADGSVLIADEGHGRVRRVDATGAISTVAGTGNYGALGSAGPAVLLNLGSPRSVRATDDGYLIGGDALWHVDSQGDARTVIPYSADFAGRTAGPLRAVTLLPDGSIAAISGERILMLASAKPRRLSVALRDLAVSHSRVRATIAATRPAAGTLEVRRSGRIIARATGALAAGTNTLVVHGRFAPGAYQIRSRATDHAGRVGGDEVTAYLGDTLSTRSAQDAISGALPTGDESVGYFVARCARMGSLRTDCETRVRTSSSNRCVAVVSVRRAADGILQATQYRCQRPGEPRFRQHPKLRFAPVPFPIAPLFES